MKRKLKLKFEFKIALLIIFIFAVLVFFICKDDQDFMKSCIEQGYSKYYCEIHK